MESNPKSAKNGGQTNAKRRIKELSPINVPKVSVSVANQIRKMIVLGELQHGERLQFEAELIEQFGVSRPTLREAIRILESEGLLVVTRGSRQGPLVQRPSVEHASKTFGLVLQSTQTAVQDIFHARLYIEPLMARLVAENASDTAPAVLRKVVEEEVEAIEDDQELTELANKFHLTLVELAGNNSISLFMQMLREVFVKQQVLITVSAPKDERQMSDKLRAIKAQNKLIGLIEKGDGPGAEKFWRKNLETMEKVILKQHENDRVVDLLSSI